MRKSTLSLLIAAFVAASAVSAWAQAPAPKPEEKKTEKPAAEKKAPAKKPAAKTASGTVKSASADSVVVAGKEKGKDAEWTFAVDAKTTIKKGGKDVTAADLKSGDPVHVRYTQEGGKQVAQAITVRAAGTAKKSEAAKPETKK
ncbi:MAG TPA: DUF5666 domain-containing protein [Gemmatimonadales bacterium]|nr:DUF5666 domain-containing protein [Gemmatimonadales bacterium]